MTKKRHYAAVQQRAGSQSQWQSANSAGRPRCPATAACSRRRPMYWLYEMGHAALNPARAFADATRLFFKNPPIRSRTPPTARRSPPPPNCSSARRAATASPNGASIRPWSAASACRSTSTTVWERPFCRLLHFERVFTHAPRRPQPKLLIVAPMSGHYATLLRGTVEAFLPNHDVYITDWVDARMVPLAEGRFDLDDYIDYVIRYAALPRRRHARRSRCASRRCRCWPRSR